MEWKTDPNLFAKKILAYIEKANSDVSYTQLLDRALAKDITVDLLDRALERLHKSKKIKKRVKDNDIVYTALPKAVIKSPISYLSWVRQNYPRPGENGIPAFVMPWPEIDMSYLFLKPEQMKVYKAEAKGMPLYMMNSKFKKKIKQII